MSRKQVFYNELTVKLISRFDQETGFGLQLYYVDNGLVKAL